VLRYTDFRFDASSLRDLPDGSIKVTGQLARPGILKYRNDDGSWRHEYRSAKATFNKESLETFAGVPVTLNHPGAGKVTAETWKQLAVGHLGDNVRQDGENIVADMYIRDAATVASVKRGDLKHLSCGYHTEFDPTPGTTDTGERYDGVQKSMRGNHVALLPIGVAPRGGSECVLRLDSAGDEVLDMPAINLTMANELEALQAANVALKGENDKLRVDAAEVPALRATVAELNKQLSAATAQITPERLDALVEDRSTLVALATANGVDPKGKDALTIKRAVIAKRTPALSTRVDAYGAETCDAVLASYAEQPHPTMAVLGTAAGTAGTVAAPLATRTDALPTIAELKAKSRANESKMWQAGSDMPRRSN
jgi:hypothetical protein